MISQKIVQQELKRKGGVRFAVKWDSSTSAKQFEIVLKTMEKELENVVDKFDYQKYYVNDMKTYKPALFSEYQTIMKNVKKAYEDMRRLREKFN